MADFRILMVCLGNVCRSPLMERLLRARLPQATVASAGLIAMAGRPIEPTAAAELARLAGSADGFVARQFVSRHADEADLVLTATAEIRSAVLRESPGALRRSFTLVEFSRLVDSAPASVGGAKELVAWAAANRSLLAGADLDIRDPMGRAPEVHREVADVIDKATRRIASSLSAAGLTTA